MVSVRAIVVLAVVFGVLLAKRLIAEFMRGRANGTQRRPAMTLPRAITDGRPRTWVLFTTPFCVSCREVEAQLGTNDPITPVVRIDASRELDLADRMGVRSAPTLMLAGPDGVVLDRFSGAAEAIAAARDAGR